MTHRHRSVIETVAAWLARHYFIVTVVAVMLFWVLYALIQGMPVYQPESLTAYEVMRRRPLLQGIVLLLSLLGMALPTVGQDRLADGSCSLRRRFTELQAPLLCFGLGYVNLLLGIFDDSLIGTLGPFLIGVLATNDWHRRPLLHPFGSHPLRLPIVAVSAFLLWELVTLLWSQDVGVAFEWWQVDLWLLLVPLLLYLYRSPIRWRAQFWHIAVRVAWVYVLTLLSYQLFIMQASGADLLGFVTFDKNYLAARGFQIFPAHIFSTIGNSHYSYIGIYLLIPALVLLHHRVRQCRLEAWGVLAALLVFGLISQARAMILIGSVMLLYAAATTVGVWLWRRSRSPQRGIMLPSYLLLAGVLTVSVGYIAVNLVGAASIDKTRASLILAGADGFTSGEWWQQLLGSGLDAPPRWIVRHGVLADCPSGYQPHLHNEWMQVLLQSGVVGLLLWGGVQVCLLRHYRRRGFYAGVAIISGWMLLMNFDLVNYLINYLIGMMVLLTLSLGEDASTTLPISNDGERTKADGEAPQDD